MEPAPDALRLATLLCAPGASKGLPHSMDISRDEQRVLHVLAQGGAIRPVKNNRGRIADVLCVNRDGFVLPIIDMLLFKKLKRRHTIASSEGGPYRITRRGLDLVRSQFDNR